jgi:hypothetical protein
VRAGALAFDAGGRLLALGPDALLCLGADGRELARVALPRASGRGGFARGGGGAPPPPTGRMARSADGRTIVLTRGRDVLLSAVGADGTPAVPVRLRMPDLPEPADGPPEPPQAPRGRGNGQGWRDFALGPDGRHLFLASGDEAGAWTIDGDRPPTPAWHLPAHATRLAMAPDGRTLAVGDLAGEVLLIDPADGRVRRRIGPPAEGGGIIAALAFSPDGRELAVASREQIRLWSLAGAEPAPVVRLGGHQRLVNLLAFDPSGRHLASGSFDGTVKVWDLDHVRGELARLGLD